MKKYVDRSKRGFFGIIFKYLFIGFNLLMIAWLYNVWEDMGTQWQTVDQNNNAELVGATLGVITVNGFIFSFWVIGDIILGIPVLLTRRREIIVIEKE